MQFNLSQFILNEALQSSVLFHEILSEPGGYFRFMQPKRRVLEYNVERIGGKTRECDTMVSRCQTILGEIRLITKYVFTHTYQDFPSKNERYCPIKENLPLEKLKRLNARYNGLFEKYMQYAKHLAAKPNPQVFGILLRNMVQTDLFNITDRNFKKMSYQDMKSSKAWFDTAVKSPEYTIFWFDKSGKMLAVSSNNEIIEYGIGVSALGKEDGGAMNTEKLDEIFSQYGEGASRIDIVNGERLEWRIPNNSISPLTFVLNNKSQLTPGYKARGKKYAVGSPGQSTSNIRKIGWNLDGYVIIYMLTAYHKDGSLDISQLENPMDYRTGIVYNDFNTWKASRSGNKKREQYRQSAAIGKYKWRKYPDGTPMPYSLLGDVFIYDIDPVTGRGKAVNVTPIEQRGNTYGDVYAYWFTSQNHQRYAKLKTLAGVCKQLPVCQKQLKDVEIPKIQEMMKLADSIRGTLYDFSINPDIRRRILEAQRKVNVCISLLMQMKNNVDEAVEYAEKCKNSDAETYQSRHFADKANQMVQTFQRNASSFSESIKDAMPELKNLEETLKTEK